MSSANINIPFQTRIPGVYITENTSNALTGLVGTQDNVILIAQKTSSGVATSGQPVTIFGESDLILQCGAGSVAHIAGLAALTANPNVASNFSVLPISDAGGATDATGTLSFTSATAAGQVNAWIGDYNIQYNYSSGDTSVSIANGLGQAIKNVAQHTAATCDTSVSAVVHIQANNGGTVGNYIALSGTATPNTGVTVTASPMAGGAGDPTIGPYTTAGTALANITAGGYTVIISSLPSSTWLSQISAMVDFVSGPLEERPATGYYAFTDLVGTLTTGAYGQASSLNDGRVSGAYISYSTGQLAKSPVFSVAAAYGAVIASQVDPAAPYDNYALVGIAPPAVPDRLSSAMNQSALNNGVAPLKVLPGEQVAILRAISTYTKNSFGFPDPTLLDITTFRTLDEFRFQVVNRISGILKGAKASPRMLGIIKSAIIDVIYLEQQLERLQNVDTYKTAVLVQLDISAVGQVDVSIPAPIISGLHVVAGTINLIL
jgi:phage tail sheath gpL-like